MQAPVTQGTGPGRVRESAWYFRRERGINCSTSVRARLGKGPTEGWLEPSGLRRANPTTPGGPAGLGLVPRDPVEHLGEPAARHDDVGVQDQEPVPSRGPPAGVDARGKPAIMGAQDQAES